MKKLLLLFIVILFSNIANAQTTAISDPVFEQVLIDRGYDTGAPDGVVPTININSITILDIRSENISDLTGIEDFTALYSLSCSSNNLTSLDLTQNSALISLNCSNNQLISLDLPQNTTLIYLTCSINQLTNLDVTQNTDLITLNCGTNQLTSLDVTQNTALLSLDFYNNQLTSIDVIQNTALTHLRFGFNQLTSIDVIQNPALVSLDCIYNAQLTRLDLAQNTALTYLRCDNNSLLSYLNVKNGNNTNFTYFGAVNNPSLTCIEVDNIAYSTTNWTNIDAGAAYGTNCPDPLGIDEQILSNLSIYPNPTTGDITINLGEVKTEITARLANSLGQLVLTQQFKSADIINLDIDTPKGIYFLTLTTPNGKTQTIKVIKE